MWHPNDMFHHVFKAEFVTLVSLKVPSGSHFGRALFFFLLVLCDREVNFMI